MNGYSSNRESFTGATGWINHVTLADPRRHNLRELLLDLSRPGLCLILGAGASHGVIPISPREIALLAREIREANRDYSRLPSGYVDQLRFPEVRFLTDLLLSTGDGGWDRILDELRSPGQATFVLNAVFTPRGDVPTALVRIYDVLESDTGVIVSYNYDRITDRQTSFEVIAPHGQRSALLSDPRTYAAARRIAFEFDTPIPTDWWLPVPETEPIRLRHEYQRALEAWRHAASIVFVGYGFGGGADAFSFEDFGANASPTARIHVLNPMPDNADLCRQVGHALRGRGPRFRVHGQPFRWRAFAQSVLEVLDLFHAGHIRYAIGHEVEIGARHDWN